MKLVRGGIGWAITKEKNNELRRGIAARIRNGVGISKLYSTAESKGGTDKFWSH